MELIGIVLLNASTSSLFLMRDLRERNIVAKVVVFIPPPVEDGEAPMNISIIVIMIAGFVSREMSVVLNPAVRGVIDKKRPFINLPPNEKDPRVLFHSRSR